MSAAPVKYVKEGLMKLVPNFMIKFQRDKVFGELRKYGLRYEDVLIHENEDYQKALKYVSEEEYQNRLRRIVRAQQLSLTHSELPKELQAIQEPEKEYLGELMEEFRKLREEREKLTA